ncbi:Antiseptic resistance protein [Pelotomaculum schinkii]|uniref:Antiseptic resistance protein n=1 Tax=Pelotomaculum schinkii TaxID=78350 RepID=A0A4Y7RFN9_9FIRM|nr:MFS transporter [Pelotomaculum schinkii]TEB07137.1 Antiseptic resistance protein [Pelotomaculum schinkii]
MEKFTPGYLRSWYVLFTVGVGTFLSSLNTSTTNTVLPTIERSLGITLVQSEWIVLIYLLVLTILLIPIGRLSDLWGHRRVLLFGFAIFTSAAVLCGVSQNYFSLLWGRALVALGGAMIMSVGPAILTTTFPIEQRGRVLGIQALMTYIGLSLGPVLGGWLTQAWGWQTIFLVTVPFGISGLLLGIWAVPKVVVADPKALDLKGTFLFILGMAAVTLLLNSNAIKQYRTLILSLLVIVFVGAIWAFIHTEREQGDPMIDLELFRINNFGFGALGAALNYLCFFLIIFLLPFYFDQVLHFPASTVGMFMAITPLVMTVCAPIAGAMSDRYGPRTLTTLGMAFNTISLALFGIMVQLGLTAHWTLIAGLIFAGLGTGTFAAPNNSAILGAAPRSQQGVASGVLATVRYIGMMCGITIGGSLFYLLIGYFTHQGADTVPAFLHAFSIVMWVGAMFGTLGFFCTFAMTNEAHNVAA